MVQRSPAVHWIVVADEAVGVVGVVLARQPLCGGRYPSDCLLWFGGHGGFAALGTGWRRVAGVSDL